eukprot:1150952-Pyramimonas_sp.AAC.1
MYPWSPLHPRGHRTTIFNDLPTQTVTEMCSRRWCRRTSLVLRAGASAARALETRVAGAGFS